VASSEIRPLRLHVHGDQVPTDAEVHRLEADNRSPALRRRAGMVSLEGGGQAAPDQADDPCVPDQGPGTLGPAHEGDRTPVGKRWRRLGVARLQEAAVGGPW
jgi:hypothetical protein